MDNLIAIDVGIIEEENPWVFKLKKPFSYEGESYTEFDFSEIEELNTADYSKLLTEYEKTYGNGTAVIPEYEMNFALMVAERVTHLPRSLFLKLPAQEGFKIRRTVMSFFLE